MADLIEAISVEVEEHEIADRSWGLAIFAYGRHSDLRDDHCRETKQGESHRARQFAGELEIRNARTGAGNRVYSIEPSLPLPPILSCKQLPKR
jgi:hypothetical protein